MNTVPILAGAVSTGIFAASTLPMLAKAYRTRDLSSYSLGNIVLANVGNAVQSVYVLSLPAGPLWVLHAFNLISASFMLAWFLRYGGRSRGVRLGVITHPTRTTDGWIARRGAAVAAPSFVSSTTQTAGGTR